MWRGIFFLLITLTGGYAWAQTQIEVIPLQHRPAAQVIPIVQPLLGSDEAISGQGFNLIVRAAPATLMQIRKLLLEIDRPLRQMTIQVRFGHLSEAERSAAQAEVRIEAGGGVKVQGQGRIVDTRETRRQTQGQQIRVLEGGQAWIQSGTAIPFRTVQVVTLPGRVAVISGQQWIAAGSGFNVSPQLRGKRVWLEINPQQARVETSRSGPPVIAQQQAATVIEAPLGEWIELAGTTQSENRSQTGILSTARRDTQEQGSIWLKVDLIEH